MSYFTHNLPTTWCVELLNSFLHGSDDVYRVTVESDVRARRHGGHPRPRRVTANESLTEAQAGTLTGSFSDHDPRHINVICPRPGCGVKNLVDVRVAQALAERLQLPRGDDPEPNADPRL